MDILIELHLACNVNTVCDLEVAVFGKLKVCRVGRPTLSPSAGMVSYFCECRSSFPTVPSSSDVQSWIVIDTVSCAL